MARAVDPVASFAVGNREANEGKGQPLFRFGEELFHTPTVDQVFEPGFLAVRAIPMLTENANHGGGHRDCLVGAKKEASSQRRTAYGR